MDATNFPSVSKRYQMRSLLGHGGMGAVYVAWDDVLKRNVALKFILNETAQNADMRQCFNREARAISLIRHPHVVEIYDFGSTEGGQIFISTELICGDSLHGLNQAPLPLREILSLIIQLLDALQYAHARGLIHRDLKAENLLVTMKNNRLWTKLADFGLAALAPVVSTQENDRNPLQFGTPGYMAPEQILSNTNYVGPCTDIYATGVLIFESLSGCMPFNGASAVEIMKAHLHQPVPETRWRPHLADTPAAVKDLINGIVQTALAKFPEERFLCAKDFSDALRNVRDKLPDTGLPSGDPCIQKIIAASREQPGEILHSIVAGSDIGDKIRAFELAEDSGLSESPHPADAPFAPIPPAPGDETSGLTSNPGISALRMQRRKFEAQIQNAMQKIGVQAEFFKEILLRTAVLGPRFYLCEAQAFWNIAQDHALADCWREALAAWTLQNVLRFQKQNTDGKSSDTLVSFEEPVYAEFCLENFSTRKLRALKTQAANALIDAYPDPDGIQSWRIASLWRESDNEPAFVQYCLQSAMIASQRPNPEKCAFSLMRCNELCTIFDKIIKTPKAVNCQLLWEAIDWPDTLIWAAQMALALDNRDDFNNAIKRLKAYAEAFSKPIILAHVQCLNALSYSRQKIFMRAYDLSALAGESFTICNDEANAAKARKIMADAAMGMGNSRLARTLSSACLDAFTRLGLDGECADVRLTLAQIEWFSGNLDSANEMIRGALETFYKMGAMKKYDIAKFYQTIFDDFDEPSPQKLSRAVAIAEKIQAHNDIFTQMNVEIDLLVCFAMHGKWEDIETHIGMVNAYFLKKNKTVPAIFNGTGMLLRAMACAFRGDFKNAQSQTTLAIAGFGPQNRRARAWCHTFLGALAAAKKDIREGAQAFERAKKDFQKLDDQIGMSVVLVAQSFLAYVCREFADAYAMAVDAVNNAQNRRFSMAASCAFVIGMLAAISDRHVQNAVSDLQVPTKYIVPDVIKTIWQDAFDKMIKQLSEMPETQNLCRNIPFQPGEKSTQDAICPSVEIDLR